jgi:uncharacterized membrane protein
MSFAHYLPLAGILIVVLGFWLKLNPMLVVTVAALATGMLAGLPVQEVIALFGKAFNDNRIIAIVWIVLPSACSNDMGSSNGRRLRSGGSGRRRSGGC